MTPVLDGTLLRFSVVVRSGFASTFLHKVPVMRFIQAAFFLALLITIGIFAVQNRDVITVNILAWSLSQPIAIVTLAAYILGMLSGWTVLTFARGTFRGATARPRQ